MMGTVFEFKTIIEMFMQITARDESTDRPVLLYKKDGKYTGISGMTLRKSAEHFALGLAGLGVRRGDRVAIIAENRPEWVVADMGIMMIGAVNVALFTTIPQKQVEYIFNNAGVSVAVVSGQLQLKKVVPCLETVESLRTIIALTPSESADTERITAFSGILEKGSVFGREHPDYLREEVNRILPDDLLALIYTSGTTGFPRGVMLSHQNLVSNMRAAADCIPFGPGDVILSYLPLGHSFQRMGGYYTAMACGVTIAFAESIDTLLENMRELRPTVVTTVPRLFERFYNRVMKQMENMSGMEKKIFGWSVNIGKEWIDVRKRGTANLLLNAKYHIADRLVFRKIRERVGGKIRFFVSGGAALAPALGTFFDSAGIRILEGYGLSEASPVISVNRLDDYRFGTVGKLLPGVEARIASDGEILVRGPNVMLGYWKDPVATAEAIDQEGWLHTGDIGSFDPDGFLRITDRKKHLFVTSGGKKIAPQPIEQLFTQNPLIDQFVLIGDGRMYLTALVVPNFDFMKSLITENNVTFNAFEDLVKSSVIRDKMTGVINLIQKDLANYERVRKFTLLPRPLTVDEGELTPTLKIRRKVVEEKYSRLIEEMYSGVS